MSTAHRDPYPYPRYESDQTLAGLKPTEKATYSKPTHLAQQDDPWSRLNLSQTLTSTRHQAFYYDPQAPNDSLDFVLKTEYDQHRELFKGKNQVLLQTETCSDEHGRVLKNRIRQVQQVPPKLGHPLRQWQQPRREDVNSIKNAIEGHHTQATNRGYSRKPDGGHFTS
ncbi:hypothetical protein BOX15_Mlig028779g3 [Macrostomum lignano]|uniref:TEX36 n=2 Tax=Macrostomum lignano TaxID=282301 RepID=A0A1I8HAG6_9PLAT|nr:hypothetical protein BOX15_Mlig028779g3 [Macrostomum lignano]